MAQLNLSKPTAKLPRNGFDLSRRAVFTLKVGEACPAFTLETVPGGHYEIKPIDLVRTLPLNTAAFGRLKQRLDFYFVPYSQLYQRFDEMIVQRHDPVSNHADGLGSNLNSLPTSLPYISLYDVLEVINAQSIYNQDSLFYKDPRPYVKLLNMLGYPITWNLFDAFKNNQLEQIQINYLQSQHVNMLPLLAYQKIWFDFYRNPYRDTNIEPIAFNDDFINDDTGYDAYGCYSEDALIKRFTPRYVRWKNDLFTASYPSAQFGNVSIAPTTADGRLLLTQGTLGYVKPDGTIQALDVKTDQNGNFYNQVTGTDMAPQKLAYNGIVQNNPFGLSILDLRRAEAMQHYRENVLRAGNKTKDNYKAHFGVEPRFIKDMHPVFLGSASAVIDINEVTQTAGGVGQTGELFGKGISTFGRETINYSANDFGMIIGIMSVLPEVEYAAVMADHSILRLGAFDFYQPEFANLGFEAIPYKAVYGLPQGNGIENQTIGFAPRDYAYKTAVDKVYGEFMDYYMNANEQIHRINKPLSPWVLNRSASQYRGLSAVYDLYVNPACVDNMFQVKADADTNTDQMLVNLWCDVKAVQPMPVLGLPNY